MKLYHTFYSTKQFVVSVTRDNEIVDICIYDKNGEEFTTLVEHTCSSVSDIQALKLTRKKFNI